MQKIKRENNAPFILIYGETNSGKSTSIMRTAPGSILYISVEGDAWKSVDVVEAFGEKVEVEICMPDGHEDLMDSLNKMVVQAIAGKFPHDTVVFDSGTFWMNVKLGIRVEDDRNVGRTGVDEGKLSAMSASDWTEVNTVNSQMSRLTDLLKTLSLHGVMVVMTAQLQENPKWNRELEAGPCFNYKEYNKALKGYFDYIGFNFSKSSGSGGLYIDFLN